MIPDSLEIWHESLPLRSAFRISRGVKNSAEVLVAKASFGDVVGYGEAVPYVRYGETIEGCLELSKSLCENPVDRQALQGVLSAGALRNAIDCALWDLEAKLAGGSIASLAGVVLPKRIESAYTLSGDSPSAWVEAAKKHSDKSLFKLKFMGDGDDEARLRGVREVRSDVGLIVDANEAWDEAMYLSMLGVMVDCGVGLIEQPFASGADFCLKDLPRPISVCADESCLVGGDLERLVGLYDVINIKLDKSGGLTHGLEMKDRALGLGFGIMVGCMVGSSLGMRAALSLCGRGVDWVDLDGPLWLREDRVDGLVYDGNVIIV